MGINNTILHHIYNNIQPLIYNDIDHNELHPTYNTTTMGTPTTNSARAIPPTNITSTTTPATYSETFIWPNHGDNNQRPVRSITGPNNNSDYTANNYDNNNTKAQLPNTTNKTSTVGLGVTMEMDLINHISADNVNDNSINNINVISGNNASNAKVANTNGSNAINANENNSNDNTSDGNAEYNAPNYINATPANAAP